MTGQKWQCRWAPSLGKLEATHQEVWSTTEYKNDTDPTVFFGLYGLPDFYALWRHKGEKHILWAGSDIRHFKNHYWLDDKGEIRLPSTDIAQWINKYCTSWVENDVECRVLQSMGIESKICPSFLGKREDFPLSYRTGNKLYTSVSGDDFNLYGWYEIQPLAQKYPDLEFHLYGNTVDFPCENNMILHGRVPKEQMNAEIKEMQGALRLVPFDGFSEIVAKSLLMGQWPVSLIKYPHTMMPNNITIPMEPNYEGREWVLSTINKYPWCT